MGNKNCIVTKVAYQNINKIYVISISYIKSKKCNVMDAELPSSKDKT